LMSVIAGDGVLEGRGNVRVGGGVACAAAADS
jgi:hypothetical protein